MLSSMYDKHPIIYYIKNSLTYLQVRLSYEVESEQLYVTIIKANDLTLRQGIFKRNPYVKMYLLPGNCFTHYVLNHFAGYYGFQ